MNFTILNNLTQRIVDAVQSLDTSTNAANGRRLYPTSKTNILDIKTYDGSNTATHPSVLYFWNGWQGYRYWMAYTPYPSVAHENPCLAVSNDGVNWIDPPGVTNPLDPRPSAPHYNSDTEIVFTGSAMRVYWRQNRIEEDNILYYRESTDGVNWGAKVTCTITPFSDFLSPSILKDGSTWRMWVGSLGSGEADYFESSNGTDWNFVEKWKATNLHPKATLWHPCVWPTVTGYAMLVNMPPHIKTTGGYFNDDTDLYYAESEDGINWNFDTIPFISREEGFSHRRVYRATVVPVGEELNVYVSGRGGVDKIGLVKAKRNMVK